jgi:hypothetical protein
MMTVLRRAAAFAAAGLLAAPNVATLSSNVTRTYHGEATATMLQRLAVLSDVSPENPVLLDIPEAFGALLAASYSRGHVTALLSGAVPSPADGLCDAYGRANQNYRFLGTLEGLACQWRASYRHDLFQVGSETAGTHHFLRYELPRNISTAAAVLVTSAADQQIVNNSRDRPADGRYHVQSLSQARDHLVQIDSSIGHTVAPGLIDDIALWPRERDFANSGAGIQGIGRHLLFEVLNPTADSRMLVDFTAGGLAARTGGLPPVQMIGEGRSGFGFVGRGAGRMLSGAIAPRMIDGHAYVAIDMGMTPLQFAGERTGILGLYNSRLGLDPRSLVGFVRNISLLTQEQIAAFAAPPSVDSFPRDLFARGLLFTGLYEDGWMAEVAKLRLRVPGENRDLRIKGSVPALGLAAATFVDVRVNGEPILTRRLAPGNFELHAPVPSPGTYWIEIRADQVARLPAPDGRVVSLLLHSIGFGPPQ